MSKFANRLKKMQKLYDAASAPAGFGESNVEPGKYKASVVGEVKDIGGKLMVEWKYTVSEGDFEGEEITQLDGLETEQNLGYLKKKVEQFGRDPDEVEVENLEGLLAEISEEAHEVSITVKQNGDYKNVYLNSVDDIDESEGEDAEEEEEVEEEEEEEVSFEKSEMVLYKKKGAKKATEFKILSVDEKKKTAKLKGIDGVVSWELLEKIVEEEEEEASEDEDTSEDEENDSEESSEEEEEEEAEAEDEGEMVELEKGSKVEVEVAGKKQQGKVLSVDEETESCKVKLDKGGKVVKVGFDQVEVLE